jgi:hypothetical protein
MSLKNSNDTIGNRTRDQQVCSVVPSSLRRRAPQNLSNESDYGAVAFDTNFKTNKSLYVPTAYQYCVFALLFSLGY